MRSDLLPGDPRHGTVVGYRTDRCRCTACRSAHALRMGAWRREQLTDGRCLECIGLAEPGRVRCAWHLARLNDQQCRARAVAREVSSHGD